MCEFTKDELVTFYDEKQEPQYKFINSQIKKKFHNSAERTHYERDYDREYEFNKRQLGYAY